MPGFNAQRYWWAVVVVALGAAFAVMEITNRALSAYQDVGDILALSIIGASFYWVYSINRERFWWAIIPGLVPFALVAAIITNAIYKPESESNWLAILVIGIGILIIGVVLKRFEAKVVLFIVAGFTVIIGLLMTPFAWAIKGVLIAGVVLIAVFLLWNYREALSGSA
jgi:hypothetical protein